MIVVLLGPPGAGKGTQGEIVAEKLGIPRIATGDVLRAAVRDGTEQGLAAKAYMDRGDLVPDSVILGIMKEVMSSPATAKGAVLDGVVRTVPQAEGLTGMLAELGKKVDKFLLFDVPEDELVNRLGGRVVCENCQTPYKGLEPGSACAKCGGKLVRRKDDEPESIRNRLKVYEAQTAPVIEWTKQKKMDLVKIDATGDIAEITERTMKALEEE
ncbi:MAG TPA: adenylate kinase [Gemmatimonadaceae bacterium]|nr:adenylate kinase [Gemmatimonadaceae bacterium]